MCCVILVKYERIKFLVVALKDGIEIYAWAPKPYHKFMAFKVTFKAFNVFVPFQITFTNVVIILVGGNVFTKYNYDC